ncbi:cell division protein FtsK [Chitinibacter fontanus]|uniref:Cell division protein FtsK n=2 Tax=Chitinibacter fontanus TaxID=1737446 RepID=A0A7D5ZHJ7_9NEIS|nr:cell division protein FtsK [Chitinibacter fontanus]
MFELPIASVTQAAAKGVGSLKSFISPVASKIGAKMADVLHSAKPDAAPISAPDPLLTSTHKSSSREAVNVQVTPTSTVVSKELASIQATNSSPLIRTKGYQHTQLSEYELAEDTLAASIANLPSGSPEPTAASVPQRDITPQDVLTERSHNAPPVSFAPPLGQQEPPVLDTAQSRPAPAILTAEQVKTPSQPIVAPRKSKCELPVLDMSHIQRNLERSQRKLAIEGAKMPERKAPEPLPVIDPSEIRERLQDIHSGKRPSPKITPSHGYRTGQSVPVQAQQPKSSAAARPAPVVPSKPVPSAPVVRAPAPEVIRVFQSSQTVASNVAQTSSSSATPSHAVETPASAASEDGFYPLHAPAIIPLTDVAPPALSMDSLVSQYVEQEQSSIGVAGNTGLGMSEGVAEVPSAAPVLQRPTQFLRPDALAPAPKVAADPAWRGEDGLCLPLELLRPATVQAITVTQEELLERSILIEEKLNEFKVKVSVLDAYAGPVITRFEVEPATGIRGAQVVNLAKDLARSLGLASVRVVETIPGKTCMGLELPNPTRQMIRLSEILSAPEYHQQVSPLTIALGKDISGIPVATDLAKTPHMLVAGTTGSGKSVGVNAMILSILFKATPDEVRFIMIDPKMLELSVYEGIPHLLAPVVTDMKLAANALNWCVGEMEKRYRLMSAMGVRNLAGFNQKVAEAAAAGKKLTNPFTLTPDDPEPLEHLPMIVVVVDEFADLMMVAGKKIEELIARLAQKARAAGIHLILATQRPSVDVITGLIKANIPTRLAFQVSSKIDSRTILDQMGAEALLGQGDMLFLPPGTGYPQRIHGAFVDDAEVHCVVEYLKQLGEPNYIEGVLYPANEAEANGNWSGVPGDAEESDPLYDEAVAHVIRSRRASISAVQRQFRIGYNRAARLIEQMESAGIVSGMESNGNRTVLVPPGE